MQIKKIRFLNQQNFNAKFDIVKLEEIFNRENLDHLPTEFHRVEFFVIIFIENGNGCHSIDFKNYKCSKGTLLTIRKDQIHKFHKSKDLNGKVLLFTEEFMVSYLEELESQKTLLLFNELLNEQKLQLTEPHEYENIYQSIKQISNEYLEINDNYSLSIIRSELHILITKLFRIQAQERKIVPDKKYLKEFVEFQKLVELNAVKTITVKDYSKMLGCSPKTLNTITRNIVNKSAKELIDDICTRQIKRLLINTKLSIKEIAYEMGFNETTNFYKYFKRNTNSTPESFRDNF